MPAATSAASFARLLLMSGGLGQTATTDVTTVAPNSSLSRL
jgi:hypothetical protein